MSANAPTLLRCPPSRATVPTELSNRAVAVGACMARAVIAAELYRQTGTLPVWAKPNETRTTRMTQYQVVYTDADGFVQPSSGQFNNGTLDSVLRDISTARGWVSYFAQVVRPEPSYRIMVGDTASVFNDNGGGASTDVLSWTDACRIWHQHRLATDNGFYRVVQVDA